MPEMIDPQRAEKQEMHNRQVNIQFAGNMMLNMATAGLEMTEQSPEKIFAFAIGCAEQMRIYMERPLEEASKLIQ